LKPQQVFQDEPRVAGPLADSAVGNHGLVGSDSRSSVQRLEVAGALERPIVVAGPGPGNALRSRNVTTTLTGLRESRGSKDLSGEFLRTPHVNKGSRLLGHRLLHFG